MAAVTRLGLSGIPRPALADDTNVTTNLAQWQWTTYGATVLSARSITTNLAQWDWTSY